MKVGAFGLIYTGEGNPLMRDLASSRAVAAIPFGGRYRVIDFILSDLVRTGVTSVGVIAQKNYHSLMDHLGSGTEWDLNRKREGLFVLPPFLTKDSSGIYRGSVDALRYCLGYVRRCPEQYIILSGSHTLFNTDFEPMLEQHIRTGADITIMYDEKNEEFDPNDQNKDLRLYVDQNGRVTDMELDPSQPGSNCKSCDVFVMDKALMEYLVEDAYSHGDYHFVRDVLLKKRNSLKIYGWKYDGLVMRLNSVKSYFESNMKMIDSSIRSQLLNPSSPVYTKVKDEIPTKYGSTGNVRNSLLADGCYIKGSVSDSVLFRGVDVGEGARISNSILMQGAKIGKDVVLDHVILDKGVTIHDGRSLAGHSDFTIVIRKNSVI